MENNLSDDEKNIIWNVIKRYEEKYGIVEHPYNYPRFRVKSTDSGGYNFWCSACNEVHHIPDNGNHSYTVFNGDLFRPTFFLKGSKRPQQFVTKVGKNICCYNIVDGVIHYLNYSSHFLSGISLELDEYSKWDTINIKHKRKQ